MYVLYWRTLAFKRFSVIGSTHVHFYLRRIDAIRILTLKCGRFEIKNIIYEGKNPVDKK